MAAATLALLCAVPVAHAQSASPEPGTEGAAPADPNSVTHRLFERGLMENVSKPATLTYDVTHPPAGKAIGHIRMDVREVKPDGGKTVFFKTDGGVGNFDFGPVDASRQNPLLIVYMQIDVARLQRLTGGSQQYFRNRIRASFNAPAKVEQVDVQFGDRRVTADKLTITPFKGDAHLDRFPELRDKSYSFIVAPDLAGGLYQIGTQVPDPEKEHALLDESVTLARVDATE